MPKMYRLNRTNLKCFKFCRFRRFQGINIYRCVFKKPKSSVRMLNLLRVKTKGLLSLEWGNLCNYCALSLKNKILTACQSGSLFPGWENWWICKTVQRNSYFAQWSSEFSFLLFSRMLVIVIFNSTQTRCIFYNLLSSLIEWNIICFRTHNYGTIENIACSVYRQHN
jgi:hypothetical protein